MRVSKRFTLIATVILITVTVDQISKILVRAYIIPARTFPIVGHYFTLTNVENTGAFLGMGSQMSPMLRGLLLLVFPILVLVYILRYILKDTTLNTPSRFAFAMIIGGGFSNVFDRVVYGSVTDFLYIELTHMLRTGIFNIADFSVTVGVIVLIAFSFKKRRHTKHS